MKRKLMAPFFAIFAAATGLADGEKLVFREYVEASGNASVDTGYVANEKTVISFKGLYVTKTSYGSLFQDYTDENSVSTRVILKNTDEKSLWISCYSKAGGSLGFDNVVTGLGLPITGVLNRATGQYVVNGQEKSYTQVTGTLRGKTIKLHASNCQTRLYSFTIREDGELLHDFRPCELDGTAGYYDIMTSVFHGKNGTTGTLVAGGETRSPDALVIIEGQKGFGSSTPAYGSYSDLEAGDEIPCEAVGRWTNDTRTVVADCTGWKLYDLDGALVDQGQTRSFTYTHPTPAAFRRLVWQWEKVVNVTVKNFDEDLATVYVNGTATTNGQVVAVEPGDDVNIELKDFRSDYYFRYAPASQTDRTLGFESWEGVPAGYETENPATFTPDDDFTVTANVDVKGYCWRVVTNANGSPTEISNHVHRFSWSAAVDASRTVQPYSCITNVVGATDNNLVCDFIERVRYKDKNYTISALKDSLSLSRAGTLTLAPPFSGFNRGMSSGSKVCITNMVGAWDLKAATFPDWCFYYNSGVNFSGRPATNFIPRRATSFGYRAFYTKGLVGPVVLENVVSFGQEVFWGNSFSAAFLTSPYLRTIDAYAFWGVSTMREVTFGACPLTTLSPTAFDVSVVSNFIFLAEPPSVAILDNLVNKAKSVDGAHFNRLTVDAARASWWSRVTLPSDNEVAAGLPANCMGVYVDSAGDHKAWIVSSNSLNGVLLEGDMTMSGTAGYVPRTGLEVGSKVALAAPEGFDICELQHLVGGNVWTTYLTTNATSFTYAHQGEITRAVWRVDGATLTTAVNNYGGNVATQLVSGACLFGNIYEKGSVVRLTATGRTTHPTSHFAAWTEGATGDDATNASILVTMDSDKSFSADFYPDEWLYTASEGTMTDGEWTCKATVTDGKVTASSFTGGQNNLLWLDVSLPVLDAADEETTYPITEMGAATLVKKVRVGTQLTKLASNGFDGTALECLEGLGASQLEGFPYWLFGYSTPIKDKTYDAADFMPQSLTYFRNYCWNGGPYLTGTLTLPNIASFDDSNSSPFAYYYYLGGRLAITNLILTCERLSVWPVTLFASAPLQSVTIGSTNLTTATQQAFTAGASTLKEIVFLAHAPAAAAFDNLVKAAKHTNMVVRCSKHAPGWRELRMADYWKQPEWSARPTGTWGMYQTLDGKKRYYMVQKDSKYDHRDGLMVIVR